MVSSSILNRLTRKLKEKNEEDKVNIEPVVKTHSSGKHFGLSEHLTYTATSDTENNEDEEPKKVKKRPKRRRGNLSIDFMNT